MIFQPWDYLLGKSEILFTKDRNKRANIQTSVISIAVSAQIESH